VTAGEKKEKRLIPAACHFFVSGLFYCVAGGVPDGIVPEGAVPDGAVPFIIPPGGVPEGAVPFIIPPGGVPEGAVPFISPPGVPEGAVPDGAALFPPACCVPVGDGVDDETALLLDGTEVLVELCVQPAIMIPAMRITDATNMSILLFFME